MNRNAKRLLVLPLVLLAGIGIAMASTQNSRKGYTISMRNPQKGQLEDIRIQELKVATTIAGGMSTTAMDITLYNPNDRLLEATFDLPLPSGWTLAMFSLDVNGKQREAVPVPKSTGRQAYKAVVRRGVDPALVEHVEGNRFSTRIYPFAARGTRRIVVTLDHPLENAKGEDVYEFPYTFDYPIKKFGFDLRIIERPTAGARIEGLEGARFTTHRYESVLKYDGEDVKLSDELRVELPREYKPTIIQAKTAEGVFFAVPLSIPNALRRAPKRLRVQELNLIWDASESQRAIEKRKTLAVIRDYLEEMDKGEVHLITFAQSLLKRKDFSVKDGKCQELVDYLKALQYDGATDLNAIPWGDLEAKTSIVVSNGIHSMPNELKLPRAGQRVYCLSSSPIRDEAWLRRISMGGLFIDLMKVSRSEAVDMLGQTNRLARWSVVGGRKEYDCPLSPNLSAVTWVYGKMRSGVQAVSVDYGSGDEGSIVADARTSPLWEDSEIAGQLRRGYTLQELSRLRSEGKEREAEALAQRAGIATPKTSLIVLENVSDYANYRIAPPAELREEYDRILKGMHADSARMRAEHLKGLIARSEAQSEWWKRKPGDAMPRPKDKMNRGASPSRPNSRRMEAKSVASPMIMREETMAMEAADDAEMDEIVVTGSGGGNKATDKSLRGSIQIAGWDSQSPYLKVLEYAAKGEEAKTYHRLKAEYGDIPAFYLDAANFFFKKGMKDEGYRALTTVLEIAGGSTALLRAVAKEMEKYGYRAEAEGIYRRLMVEASYLPQPIRDLALLIGQDEGRVQEAVELLYSVATGLWEGRFNGIDLIALNEMNALINRFPQKVKTKGIEEALLKKEPVDVRIVLSWANDDVDVDLHVVDPRGEECYFGHRETMSLGKISNDMTRGFGPEEYMQRRGMKGEYTIKAKLFGDRTQAAIVPKYVHAECYLYYGTDREQKQEITLRLKDEKEMVTLGKITFK
ncbi:MAG: hypothetical protein CSA97_04185 [Bacteroidetes bacterium]|nr:MAG: hypothetical protein CSA97_04185 [Bacteroidota bacterium]